MPPGTTANWALTSRSSTAPGLTGGQLGLVPGAAPRLDTPIGVAYATRLNRSPWRLRLNSSHEFNAATQAEAWEWLAKWVESLCDACKCTPWCWAQFS